MIISAWRWGAAGELADAPGQIRTFATPCCTMELFAAGRCFASALVR